MAKRESVWKSRIINVPHYILECPYCEFSVDETEIDGRSLPLFCGGCGARLRTQEEIDEIKEVTNDV